MLYYSTNKKASKATLQEAVVAGLAPDGGLYMPEKIERFPNEFFNEIENMCLTDISKAVATLFFGEDVPNDALNTIAEESLNFDITLVRVEEGIYALELFHGPTLAFKDVGARFMARMLSYFVSERQQQELKVLVATSGDTGSAVANGFLGVKGIQVFVLYPSGKVSEIQEAQFTTLGQNIVALEVNGTFDDCQAMVKSAFIDGELNSRMNLTSANSINVARFLPQSFYYYWAYAQLVKISKRKDVVIAVPSGNLGNLTAGLFAKQTGLPVKRFIAANNRNDVFYRYLKTGEYNPGPSILTVANAMDVGAPSNFDRILDLFGYSHKKISDEIEGFTYCDNTIKETIREVYHRTGYLLDPHGACAYKALKEGISADETGIFLATAHPAKFKETVDACIGTSIEIPEVLKSFMKHEKKSIQLSNDFDALKKVLVAYS